MKIVMVGDWYTNIYEEPLAQGFEKLGHSVYKFKYSKYFQNAHTQHYRTIKLNWAEIFYYKIQNKLLIGTVIQNINNDLKNKCIELQPDLVFFYSSTPIRRSSIMKIKVSTKAKMFSYHNDDPFAYSRLQNRNYIKSLDLMDWNYVYRVKNVNDVKKYSKYCEVLLPYPNTDCIFPIKDIEKKYDVVFIGHYEDDGRDRVICELIKDDSINFMLFGTNWDKSKSYAFIQENLGEILPVYLNDYNRVLNESKIALCFFSSLNNDEYTRRTFEIPASGTILLSQYSKESTMILKPNIEAVYFTSTLNLITQLKQYLSNESLRAEIAINGFNKVINGGHTYLDRVKQIIHRFNSIVDDSNNIS